MPWRFKVNFQAALLGVLCAMFFSTAPLAHAGLACEQTILSFAGLFTNSLGLESDSAAIAIEFKANIRSQDGSVKIAFAEVLPLVPMARVRDGLRPRTVFLDSAGRQLIIENSLFSSGRTLENLPSVPNVQKQCGGSCYLFSNLYALSQASYRSQEKDLDLVQREVQPKEIAENSPLSSLSFENVFFNFLKRIEKASRENGPVTLNQALSAWPQLETSSRRLKENGVNSLDLSRIAPGLKSQKLQTANDLANHLTNGGTAVIGGILQAPQKAKKIVRIDVDTQGRASISSGPKVEFISPEKNFLGRIKDHIKFLERNRKFTFKLDQILREINSGQKPNRDQAYELMKSLSGENLGHAVSALHYFTSGPHEGKILIYDSAKSTFEFYPLAELRKVEKELILHGIQAENR